MDLKMEHHSILGLGLVQVIQDRFVQTGKAYSGWLGSGAWPLATVTVERRRKDLLLVDRLYCVHLIVVNRITLINYIVVFSSIWIAMQLGKAPLTFKILVDVSGEEERRKHISDWFYVVFLSFPPESRCMCWSGHMWMNSSNGWESCLSVCCSPPA